MLIWVHDSSKPMPKVTVGTEVPLTLTRIVETGDDRGMNVVGIVRIEETDTPDMLRWINIRIRSRLGV